MITTRVIYRTVLATLASVAVFAAPAPDWQTVDDFTYAPAGSAAAHAAFATPSGEIYVAGFATLNGTSHAILRRATEDQLAWTTLDDFVHGNMLETESQAVHVTSSGIILTAILSFTPGPFNEHWLVRRSADHGATWQTVEDLTTPKSVWKPVSLATDPSGTVFALGYSQTANVPGYSWVLRVSSDAGQTWRTASQFNSSMVPWGMISLGSDLFAVGDQADDNGDAHSVVLKSSNSGTDWQTVDLFLDSWRSVAFAIAGDTAGNLYAAGYLNPYPAGPFEWFVRGTKPGGTNWVTSEVFEAGRSSYARSVALDKEGNAYVTGQATTGTGPASHLITRQYSASTGLWTTSDDFSLSPTNSAIGFSTVVSAGDSMFAVGSAADSNNNNHWIVRKLPGEVQPGPALQISRTADLISVSWPATATNYTLQASTDLDPPIWTPVSAVPQTMADRSLLTFAATNHSSRYFRLAK